MLAFTPRFAILATFCSLAAVSLSPLSAVAIAVGPRHSEAKDATTPVHHQKHPTVPLPAAALRKSKLAAAKKGAKKASASAGEKHKSDGGRFKYDFADSVAVEARHHGRYKKIIIDGEHGIRVGRDHHSNYGREREQVIVKGEDAHIHVEDHDHNWPHGEKIIIKGDNAHVHGRRSIVTDDRHIGLQATFKVRRDEQAAPVPGTVLIMSPVYNSSDREIAALYMDTSTDEYVLNASDTQRTALSVAKASIPTSQNTEDSDDVAVFLQTLISSNSSSTPVPHCATYDPNPAQAEPMKMTPCDNTTTADAHRSQLFAYNERTGVIRPMALLEDEGPNNATSPSAPSNDANSWNSTAASNGTTSSNSTAPSNGTTSAATAGSTPGSFARIDAALTGSQNVVLKFVPDDVKVEDTQDPASNGTMTTTATVTVTNTASESASSQSLSAADVTSATDDPVSSTLSSGTLTASASSALSTIDGASPSSTSAGALKVEVISPSDSSSASTTPSASSTTVASSSIDAAAVASSIAASNAAASSSSTINASSSPTSAPTTVAISGRDGVAAPKLTPASTAPYKWMFKAESR
ncbi:hypothetical protein K443DRAFT_90850 [Laccaria amethystina LaAM-08-1]|uniref:Uncharacterized protein n=1 Tax=Laccaria amethystina LaAM-08-1 TaxID=1095629 RepID=A0A0C9YC25_9AGAR|nr:hypothetical protein K443DRAFT_90850 [Laccaria amethystina LaAM-08-1]